MANVVQMGRSKILQTGAIIAAAVTAEKIINALHRLGAHTVLLPQLAAELQQHNPQVYAEVLRQGGIQSAQAAQAVAAIAPVVARQTSALSKMSKFVTIAAFLLTAAKYGLSLTEPGTLEAIAELYKTTTKKVGELKDALFGSKPGPKLPGPNVTHTIQVKNPSPKTYSIPKPNPKHHDYPIQLDRYEIPSAADEGLYKSGPHYNELIADKEAADKWAADKDAYEKSEQYIYITPDEFKNSNHVLAPADAAQPAAPAAPPQPSGSTGPSGYAGKGGKVTVGEFFGGKRRSSKWGDHVKAYAKAHNKTFFESLKLAKSTYKK